MPLFARILSYLNSTHTQLEGPYSLGRASLPSNTIGSLFLMFCVITFNFPSIKRVNEENMNYTSAAVGVVMLIAAGDLDRGW
jgi:hypothetical protein